MISVWWQRVVCEIMTDDHDVGIVRRTWGGGVRLGQAGQIRSPQYHSLKSWISTSISKCIQLIDWGMGQGKASFRV